jgi:hypothetical protein
MQRARLQANHVKKLNAPSFLGAFNLKLSLRLKCFLESSRQSADEQWQQTARSRKTNSDDEPSAEMSFLNLKLAKDPA